MWIKNFGTGDLWLPGVIESTQGPVNFSVTLTDGRLRRCHADQMRPNVPECPIPNTSCYSN